MGKAAAAGVLVALVAGLAIGYLVLPIIFPAQASDPRQTFWIDDASTVQATETMTDIPGLRIDFNIEAGDEYIITFTCGLEFSANVSAQTHQILEIELFLDEIYTPSFFYQTTTDHQNTNSDSIYFDYYYSSSDPGPHNITARVQYSGMILIMNIKNPMLTVQIV